MRIIHNLKKVLAKQRLPSGNAKTQFGDVEISFDLIQKVQNLLRGKGILFLIITSVRAAVPAVFITLSRQLNKQRAKLVGFPLGILPILR